MRARDVSTVSRPLIVILVSGLILRLLLLPLHGQEHDVVVFTQWARVLETFGTHGLYDRVEPWSLTAINYPPGYALLLLGVVRVYSLVAPAGNMALLHVLLKVPAVFADIACAAIVYSIVVRYASRTQALVAAAIATFAPWTWPLSAIMGQVDSVCAMFLLLALDLALDERYAESWLALGAGTLVKPFPILVVPLLLAAQVRSEGLGLRLLAGPALALVLAYALAVPFAPSAVPPATFAWLAHEYGAGQGLFPLTSFFAANVWTAISNPVPDTRRVLGLSLQAYGWLAFCAAQLFVLAVMLRRMNAANTRMLRAQAFVAAWFLVLLALFVLTTRMHERYLAYALSIAPALWPLGAAERRTIGILTVTFLANVGLAIAFGSHGAPAFSTLAVRLISIANIATLAYAAYGFYDGERRNFADEFSRPLRLP